MSSCLWVFCTWCPKTCSLGWLNFLNCPWVWVRCVSALLWPEDLSGLDSCHLASDYWESFNPPVTLIRTVKRKWMDVFWCVLRTSSWLDQVQEKTINTCFCIRCSIGASLSLFFSVIYSSLKPADGCNGPFNCSVSVHYCQSEYMHNHKSNHFTIWLLLSFCAFPLMDSRAHTWNKRFTLLMVSQTNAQDLSGWF